jgi:adenylylsulfate kinase
MRVLIMGLPGSGKTTLALKLKASLEKHGKSVLWLNADNVRKIHDDWDFSHEGRLRQAVRMANYAGVSDDDYTIADFIAPTNQTREIFNADFTIWMDTISQSRYEDTNKVFQNPDKFDVRVVEKDLDKWLETILTKLGV